SSRVIARSPSTRPTSGTSSRARCRDGGDMIHDMKEAAAVSPLAGRPAPMSMLVDLARLERGYYARKPEMDDPTQVVSFGTSGHRGSPFRGSFTEAHIAAIAQAICDYRRGERIDGPLYMGKDTHALSEPAHRGDAAGVFPYHPAAARTPGGTARPPRPPPTRRGGAVPRTPPPPRFPP